MNAEQLEKVLAHIESTIKVTVNGKIDRIDRKIDEYIIQDNLWKKNAEPVIALGENLSGFGTVFMYFLGMVGAVIGVILGISNLRN